MNKKSERGQSLVELAISIVILLYLLSGAVEFGIAFFQYVQLRDAAQEGALYGSMNPSDVNGITERIKYSSNSPLDLPTAIANGDVTVDISIDGVPSTAGGYASIDCEGHGLEVQVSYTHEVFMPFMCPVFNICEIDLNASVTDTILSPFTCT
ncbi:MAG: TadE/TadG family type IV pilus assembly protein [Anaerolineales bacterium]